MLVRGLYNELFACEERRWEFHVGYQRLFGVPNAIHQFGQSQGRSRSIVQISSTYAVHGDRRPSVKERAKRNTRKQPSSAALSGQMPEADAQVLDRSGRQPDRYPGFQWIGLLRDVESYDLKKELDGGNQQASRCYRHEVCYRDSLG